MNKLTIGLFIALLSTMLVCGCSASETDKLFATQNAQKNTAGILDHIDKAERDCISKTADTYEMNKCSQIAQQSWEKDIRKNLAELKKILNQDDYKKLQLSQTSWENYRNKDYSFIDSVISYRQGTMYQNFREAWRTEILKQRALILREYVNTLKED